MIEGRHINARRKGAGLSLNTLAELARVSVIDLEQALIGKKAWDKEMLAKVSEAIESAPKYHALRDKQSVAKLPFAVKGDLLQRVFEIIGDRIITNNKYDMIIRDINPLIIQKRIEYQGYTYKQLARKAGYPTNDIQALCEEKFIYTGQGKGKPKLRRKARWRIVVLSRVLAALGLAVRDVNMTPRTIDDYYKGIAMLEEWQRNYYME